ncbi:hypothetical protein ACFLRC_03195 [Candidatus Altiarchaeota archaeon]
MSDAIILFLNISGFMFVSLAFSYSSQLAEKKSYTGILWTLISITMGMLAISYFALFVILFQGSQELGEQLTLDIINFTAALWISISFLIIRSYQML